MMIVDFEIAVTFHVQIKQPVLGKQFKHVFEKRQSDRYLRLPTTIEIELDAHVCLFRLATNVSLAVVVSFGFHATLSLIDRSLRACPHSRENTRSASDIRSHL